MSEAGCRTNDLATGNAQDCRMKGRNKKFTIAQEKVKKQTNKHGGRIRNGKDRRFWLQQRVTLVDINTWKSSVKYDYSFICFVYPHCFVGYLLPT